MIVDMALLAALNCLSQSVLLYMDVIVTFMFQEKEDKGEDEEEEEEEEEEEDMDEVS